jgi:hypothetical protein
MRSNTIRHALAAMLLPGALTLSVASANTLTIQNPNFSAVSVECPEGYAYQAAQGGNCNGPSFPQQDLDLEFSIGWTFAPLNINVPNSGDGLITGSGTTFEPPSFTGLPFSQAALLEGSSGVVLQKVSGFLAGEVYELSFYLGSRYASGCCDGNQTVMATLDGKVIGIWALTSFTPFTLRKAIFRAGLGGSHILAFQGVANGDHTAFFSGVSLGTFTNVK